MLRFALVAAVALTPLTADADCATWGLTPKVMTPANATLPSDGGILIAAMPTPGARPEKGDAAVQPTWRYKNVGPKPAIATLAPGLAVMRVPGSVELVDGNGGSLIKVATSKDAGAALAAPMVKSITRLDRGDPGYHGSSHVIAELTVPPPAGAVAVILSDAKGARSWGLIADPKSSSVEPYVHQYCRVLPNGTVPSVAGDKVTLTFVDATGRLSPASKPVKVAGQSTASP